jgi:hypothetical protein
MDPLGGATTCGAATELPPAGSLLVPDMMPLPGDAAFSREVAAGLEPSAACAAAPVGGNLFAVAGNKPGLVAEGLLPPGASCTTPAQVQDNGLVNDGK